MPNNTTVPAVDLELEEDDDFDPTDYGFIISADGELKSIMYPEDLLGDPPEEIQLILKLFGISGIDATEGHTIH